MISFEAIITVAILLTSAIFFMNGKLRSDLVAICALLCLILFGILTPSEALSGFSNSVVIMMIGLFVVGGAIFQTGLAKMISSRILRLAGNNETKLLILIMCVTASIGAFVSNTGTVALMLPIVVSMAMSSPNINTSRLLMPLAFASSMGGMLTLIGTPPNLVINDVLVNAGYTKLSFFSFFPVGFVSLSVGILFLIPASKYILAKKGISESTSKRKGEKSLSDLVNEYQLSKNLYRVQVQKGSSFIEKSLKEINLSEYSLSVLEIRRKSTTNNPFFKTMPQEVVRAGTIIFEGDILYLQGSLESVEKIATAHGLTVLDIHHTEEKESNELDFNNIGIAEVLIMPTAKLVNLRVQDSKFRENYGLNILGIQRKDTYILQNLKDEKMLAGDILLVQGTWEHIAHLSEERRHLLVLGQPMSQATKVTLTHKAPIAALIMFAMIVVMMFDFIPISPVTAVLLASVLMVLTGALRNVEDAYKTINWESIVLIGAMLPMALALEKTGVSNWVSQTLVGNLGDYSPYVLLTGVYFTTSLMTMFISNTATAVLLAPIAIQSATALGINPQAFLFAVATAASMCFASPFSTPPNALVMSAGRYSFMDYVKVGLPLQILMGIVMILLLPLLFPFK